MQIKKQFISQHQNNSKMNQYLLILFTILPILGFSQINEIELVPDGLVFPRMNTTQRNLISPIIGQCIFNTQTKALECFDGIQWTSGAGSATSSLIIDGDEDTSIELEQNPDEDIIRFKTNGTEVMNLNDQSLQFPNTGQSVFIGQDAGVSDDLSNNRNTFVGSLSGQVNVNGSQNVAVGHQAMKDNISGSSNVAIGQQALQKNKNSNNIAIGFNAARDNNTGTKNISIGGFSGFANQLGNENTIIGYEAGRNSVNTSGNVMIGHRAGMNETGDDRLYIANSNTNAPLIFGEFDDRKLKTNGSFEATERIKVGDNTSSPTAGTIRYNTEEDDFEGWNGYQWLSLTKKTAEYGPQVTDIDGNDYRTVKIGKQLWMAENLKVTKYNDGTNIQNISSSATWSALNTGAWCYYDNDSSNDDIYGKLYNYYTLSNDKLCPTGWHVPSHSEYYELLDFLGPIVNFTYSETAGNDLKEAGTRYWNPPNGGANNSSGFAARPGGKRTSTGTYIGDNTNAYFWRNANSGSAAKQILLYATLSRASISNSSINYKEGHSVRCIKD